MTDISPIAFATDHKDKSDAQIQELWAKDYPDRRKIQDRVIDKVKERVSTSSTKKTAKKSFKLSEVIQAIKDDFSQRLDALQAQVESQDASKLSGMELLKLAQKTLDAEARTASDDGVDGAASS